MDCFFYFSGGTHQAMVIRINLFTILVCWINIYPKEKKLFLFRILIILVPLLI